ncbi:MAG TPA: SdrD B-like domain-containing protein, partial [Tepidisphaeraceae bacterium]
GAAGPVNPSSELTGSISGVVFNDFNRNGVRDPDDSGRAGWVVYHDRDNDGVLDGGETTAVTNGAGLFTFASLPPGAYNLKLSVPSGSEWTTPVPPAVTVTAGGSVTGLLFGAYTPPVTPPANQIIDLARTAIITASSQENSTNTAAKAADGISSTRWASAYTDNQWITVDLRAPYTVVTGVRLNWEAAFGRSYKVQTSQDGLVWTDRIVVTSSDGGVDEHTFSSSVSARYVRMLGVSRATRYGYSLYDFNVYGPAGTGNPVPPQDLITGSISGYTFNDSDKDGVLDTGESKAGGKTVFLDANNNSRLDSGERSVVTASDGSYTFTALAAGTHRVRRVFPTGYTYSTPLIDLTLSAGQKVTNAVIGSRTI